jgi:hypothetical protein
MTRPLSQDKRERRVLLQAAELLSDMILREPEDDNPEDHWWGVLAAEHGSTGDPNHDDRIFAEAVLSAAYAWTDGPRRR